ncbi:MAG TPA: bifunctional 3-(3-hydroxy-phenyl)propionate/3-hydroxycinnamic acid hydroxylase, partial [Jatrophihabitans sp.]|nr:bifunctional 3-(3-hydroxy-phenyl)propionate/3-hydroxycinnamic acid hydroxylase [Jatrophihabitans sp.]
MTDFDLLIVGYGPVGQTLAAQLARRGHRVGVVERWPAAYPRPRAVHFDDEIARVFAATGLRDQLDTLTEPGGEYDWQNADGRTLLHFDWSAAGPSGWCTANMFSQPALEAALSTLVDGFDNVTVRRGSRAIAIADHGDAVEVTAADADGREQVLRARYVVGCDGANSFVRTQMGAGLTDLGFFYDWLIVDLVIHDGRPWTPSNLQICDPVRPTTRVSGGPGKRRWEFMRLPHETIEELNTEATAWRLLEPWGVTPENATLERHTVYTFQARWADRWRVGRLLLAGDAAHLMPPFAGQGMCSGIRDVANLVWKLDLVLTGRAPDALLDTYTSERSAHVQHSIAMSVELGHVICLTDPDEVARRDEAMLKAEGRPELALPPVPPPVLGPGVLYTDASGAPVLSAGQLGRQGRVRRPGGDTARFDEVVGTGFVLLSTVPLDAVLDAGAAEALRALEAHVVQVVAPGAAAAAGLATVVEDVDGTYQE